MRDTNINFKKKEGTNVKKQGGIIESVDSEKRSQGGIINFEEASNGSHDEGDKAWNAFKFYGDTDKDERDYKNKHAVSKEVSERARKYVESRRIGKSILAFLQEVA